MVLFTHAPLASVARNVTVYVPAVSGVPEIRNAWGLLLRLYPLTQIGREFHRIHLLH